MTSSTIREFPMRHPAAKRKILHGWARDASPHIFLQVSAGTHPRLRLRAGMAGVNQLESFIDNPRPRLILLEVLKDDPSYVVLEL